MNFYRYLQKISMHWISRIY